MNSFVKGSHWYVVRTKPKNEKLACHYLEQHNITTFLPWMETSQCNTGKEMKTFIPLFPNYIFVQFDVMQNYPLVKWGKGVNTILGFGKNPTPIADEVISILKSRTDDEHIVKRAYNFNCNDQIRITSGPLKDLLGIFERWVSDSGRVRILLNLIGYQPRVELHYSQVEKFCA
jgi:transcription elongation factor/antiterminator RfaH